MILYGSQTSPFVRRLRLLLPANAYSFQKVDIFNPTEREKLLKISPLLKIPILEIDGEVIWDSRVIFNELCKRGFHPALSLHQENLLTAMSDLSDSLVQVLLASRSKVEFPQGSPLDVSHRERIKNTLNYLNQRVFAGDFDQWNFLTMCLYTLIDWIEFRQLVPLESYPQLKDIKGKNQHQPLVQETDPRLG